MRRFCSTNEMMGGAWLSGWMMDWMIPSIFFWLLYREWKQRGWTNGYTPPEP